MATTVERAPTRAEVQGLPTGLGWKTWALLGSLGLAYAPLLWQHAVQLWLRPHYQFFPLAVVGAAWLAYERGRGLASLSAGRSGPAATGLGLCLLGLAAAVALDSSWLAAATLPPLLGSLAYAAGGSALLRRMLPALTLLAVCVPPPLELDRDLILALQRRTTVWSSAFLDLAGVFHVMAGNVVEVGGEQLLVDEACSGINSLFVVVACALFVVFHERRPAAWAILLLLSAVGWVLLTNVARVTLLTLLKARHGIDLTTGWKHDAFGFLLFAVALAMIWSTDRLLRFLFVSSEEEDPAPAAMPPHASEPRPAAARPAPLFWGVILTAIALAAVQADALGSGGVPAAAPAPSAALERLDVDTLPKEWGRWKREEFATRTRNPGSYFGEVSKMWTYQLGKNGAVFSLDYPFPGWHDLTRCYTGQGWAVSSQTVHPAEGGQDGPAHGFVEVVLTRPGYREGYLLFSQVDRRGNALRPRSGGAGLSLFRHDTTLERWRRRLAGLGLPLAPGGEADTPAREVPPIYQAQLLVETFTPLGPAEQQAARAFFQQALPRVTKHLKGDSSQ